LNLLLKEKSSCRKKKISSKTCKFLEYCILCMGILSSLFSTLNTLTLNNNSINYTNHFSSCLYRDNENTLTMKDIFDFSKLNEYNENVMNLNVLCKKST